MRVLFVQVSLARGSSARVLPVRLKVHMWTFSAWLHNAGNAVQVREAPQRGLLS